MYINKSNEQINDLQLTIKGCENTWIKLFKSNVIVSAIYRHPKSTINDFTTALNATYQKLSNKIFYTLGDLNIDTSCKPLNNKVHDFLNMLATNCSSQIVTLPTRVTQTTLTAIDHILTYDHLSLLTPDVIRTDLSDHCVFSNSMCGFQALYVWFPSTPPPANQPPFIVVSATIWSSDIQFETR